MTTDSLRESITGAILREMASLLGEEAPLPCPETMALADAALAAIEASGFVLIDAKELADLRETEANYEMAMSAAEDRRFC